MHTIQENFSLKDFNTFGIDVIAKFFFQFEQTSQIKLFLSQKGKYPVFILGEGSNVLFTKDFEGVVIHPVSKGIEVIESTDDSVLVRVMSGEVWDDFVRWAVEKNYSGIENLSLIPGLVGAAPVQNIGAYGAEISNVIHQVEYVDINTSCEQILNNAECKFAYRDSIFKNELRNKALIAAVIFKLQKDVKFNTSYKDLNEELKNYPVVNLITIRQAVINIRQRKLPDTKLLGNAGSFFKNPVIKQTHFETLQTYFPQIVHYPMPDDNVKLSAAWLIDQCGWKGKSFGNAGVHAQQPLVLVNRGNATGGEIIYLANKIKQSVLEKFGVSIETEVNII